MNGPRRVAVVVGSSRPTRICPGIAEWICADLQKAQRSPVPGVGIRYELLDLMEVGLPLFNEPLIPALGEYECEHTRAWSEIVSGYDGFVLVFPQYNWGYPAVLKNALDYLYREWVGKPVTFATYGTRGGNRAARQLQLVLVGLHMRELYDHLEIVIALEDVDSNWQVKDLDALLGPYRRQLGRVDRQMREAFRMPRTPGIRLARPYRSMVRLPAPSAPPRTGPDPGA